MIPLPTALDYILRRVKRLPARTVPIERAAGGVLARDVAAPFDLPPFDNSAMDGFAVRRSDLASLPGFLKLAGEIRAGQRNGRRLGKGETFRIATGAPLPPGADAVIPVEDARETARGGITAIEIAAVPAPKQFIRPAGGVAERGEKALAAGASIGAGEIALLAALGIKQVRVYPQPRVGIISTGNELAAGGARPRAGKIFDCNRYSLAALIEKHGGIPLPFGIAADNEESLGKAFRKAAAGCDFILATGGVSVGRADLVKKTIKKNGRGVRIMRVAVRPGKPLVFGRIGETAVFGLPGNPVSAIVSFVNFVLPALKQARGVEGWRAPAVKAVLAADYKVPRDRLHFARAILHRRGENWHARLDRSQGSADLLSLTRSNAFLILPAGRSPLKKGRLLTAIPFEGLIR